MKQLFELFLFFFFRHFCHNLLRLFSVCSFVPSQQSLLGALSRVCGATRETRSRVAQISAFNNDGFCRLIYVLVRVPKAKETFEIWIVKSQCL